MKDQKKKPFPNDDSRKGQEDSSVNPSQNLDRSEENNRVNTTNDPADQIGKDQGRASFTTGSTTQGGSNHGQGSSQLGGSVYQQGDAANAGANYENEAGRLGNTGTQAEGYNPPGADAQAGFAAHTQAGKQNASADEGDGGQRQGGGATGYDVEREQQQVDKERGDMHNERDLQQLNVEERQDPSRGNEGTPNINTPGTPNIPPSTGGGPGNVVG